MKKRKTLFIIADAARMRLVVKRDGHAIFDTIQLTESTKKLRSSELVTDRPGRSQSAHGARHATPGSDPIEMAKHEFVRKISEDMRKAIAGYDRIILCAPPTVLGEMRKAMDRHLAEKISDELAKDLTRVPDRHLAEHLLDYL